MKSNLDSYVIYDQKKLREVTVINIMLTSLCQNKCWYCYAGMGEREVPDYGVDFLSDEVFYKVMDFIDAQDRKYVDVHFIGGEPTLHPRLKDYIRMLHARYGDRIEMHMTSNIQKPIEYWEDWPITEPIESISGSFHSDWVKDPDEYFKVAKYMASRNMLEHVRFMAQKNNLELIKTLYHKYKDDVPLAVSFIHQTFGSHEMVKFIEENPDIVIYSEHEDGLTEEEGTDHKTFKDIEIILKDGTRDDDNFESYYNFKDMMCCAGYDILPDGKVKFCWEDKEHFLDLTKDEVIKAPIWHICQSSWCNCELHFQKCSVSYFAKHIKGTVGHGRVSG